MLLAFDYVAEQMQDKSTLMFYFQKIWENCIPNLGKRNNVM